MISFGAVDDKPATVVKAGKAIVAALKAHGFSVKWDGSEHERILIEGYG